MATVLVTRSSNQTPAASQAEKNEVVLQFGCQVQNQLVEVHFLQGFYWEVPPRLLIFSISAAQYPRWADRHVHRKLLQNLKQQHSQLIKEDEICLIQAIS